ncbi:MAG: crossover junction endodeoxyribonuclease RuvC [bacterium]
MPKSRKEIILGIDPGLADTGYGVIEYDGYKTKALGWGSIKTKAKTADSERLVIIRDKLVEIIKLYKPDRAGIEKLYFARNTTSALLVGQARGVVLLTLKDYGLPIVEFTPSQIKQTLTSYGAADKKQMTAMVRLILKLDKDPKPDDAADGLAVALTTAWSKKFG